MKLCRIFNLASLIFSVWLLCKEFHRLFRDSLRVLLYLIELVFSLATTHDIKKENQSYVYIGIVLFINRTLYERYIYRISTCQSRVSSEDTFL